MLHLKLAMLGTESSYVLDYHRENPLFPHQTTLDQFFDEAQFEAYRKLGQCCRGELPLGGVRDGAAFLRLRRGFRRLRSIC